MSKIIGFANTFYTLWEKQIEPQYITDSYGNHRHVNNKEMFFYLKNISTDLNKVRAIYPNVPIDDGLRGKSRDFSCFTEEDLCPEILKFGKYKGKNIADIAKDDMPYLIWCLENAYAPTKKAISELPEVIDHLAQIERENEQKANSYPVCGTGKSELTFLNNPNNIISDEFDAPQGCYGKNYAVATIGEGNRIYVCFDEIKRIEGMYPYNMAIINGVPKKVKNKSLTLNLEILHTHKTQFGVTQFAIIK